jgi:DNA-directed RNA polymerase subunit L
MPTCENCATEHDGSYGSGRFCSAKCARCFSTKAQRLEINLKVSKTLSGRTNPLKGYPLPDVTRQNILNGIHQAAQHRFLEWANKWYKGEIIYILPLSGRLTNKLKKALILLRGNHCEKCGWSEIHPITGNTPIQLHHKDGNHENNVQENLELLCPNCHSLTPNYMALNDSGKPGKRYN